MPTLQQYLSQLKKAECTPGGPIVESDRRPGIHHDVQP